MNGKVWLVGAGPGDAGLFTLRGKEVLAQADVVVYDALVGQGVLGMIPDKARLIYAGKRAGNHALHQGEINQILLEEAQRGNQVVRLKGGDPFLFGRGGEELELLAQKGIPFEVVPGVPSAFAVPAYQGIPVTHRELSSSVHIITGHRQGGHANDIDFEGLARLKGTLIFLMGVGALPDLCDGLLRAGMDAETPAAVLERGTTAKQRRLSGTLGTLASVCQRAQVQTPAIIVVGPVCALAEEFSWYEHKPLAGVKVAVTRPKELISSLASLLRQRGAEVLELPAISAEPIPENRSLEESIRRLEAQKYDWLVFTSPSGVRIFMEELYRSSDIRALAGTKIAAIGQGSQKALASYGVKADFLPTIYDGRTLGRELAAQLPPNARILIPRAAIGNQELVEELSRGEGVQIDDIATYDTLYTASRVIDEKEAFKTGEIDFAVFTSASTVKGFAASVGALDFSQVKAVCIGKQTQAAAEVYGMQTWVAQRATLEALVQCVEQAAADCQITAERSNQL